VFHLRLDDLDDLASFTRVNSLENADAFTYFKVLDQLNSRDFDCELHFVFDLYMSDPFFSELLYDSLAALERPINNSAAVSYLNLQIGVVHDCLEESLVLKEIPLVLIRIKATHCLVF